MTEQSELLEDLLRSLINRRTALYDARAAEFSRRQAVLDAAVLAGRDPAGPLNDDEQREFDYCSLVIAGLTGQISVLDNQIDSHDQVGVESSP